MKTNRIILSVFTVFITIFSAGEELAENKLEEAKKIELLLAGIGTMENVVFIRNGKEYSANKGGGYD
jgi:NhaP-type Na+/H+ or K+/H+ antiporter